MNITENLRPILAKMQSSSCFDAAYGRIICSAVAKNKVASLLVEINETILARTLVFTAINTGAQLGLDIVSRRVLRISHINLPKEKSVAKSIIGKMLTDDDDIQKVIRDFTDGAKTIAVTSLQMIESRSADAAGLPVSRIADLMSVDLHAGNLFQMPVSPAIAEKFQKPINNAVAWFVVEGKNTGMSAGEPELVKLLRQAYEGNAESIHSHLDQLAENSGQDLYVILGEIAADAMSIICVRDKSQLLFAITSGQFN